MRAHTRLLLWLALTAGLTLVFLERSEPAPPPEPTPEPVDEPPPPPAIAPDPPARVAEAEAPEPFFGYCPDQAALAESVHRPSLSGLIRPGLASDPRVETALAEERAGRPGQALDLAHRIWKSHQDSVWAAALVAMLALEAREPLEARRALEAALDLSPGEPALGLALSLELRNTARLSEAIRALDTYLATAPADAAMHQLRARLELQQEIHAPYQKLSGAGIELLYHPELDEKAALGVHRAVADALSWAAKITEAPRREELLVVVYEDRSALLAVTCVPAWAGGVFDGVLRLFSDAGLGAERVQRIIRHECLHAELSRVLAAVPTWFNEGLAQIAEGNPMASQIAAFSRIQAQGTYIPFASMNANFLAFEDPADARLAYLQSLAMVELLRAHAGDRAIPEAVEYLRKGGRPDKLLEAVAGRPLGGDDLLAFIKQWLADRNSALVE